jgi:hypothetical protein
LRQLQPEGEGQQGNDCHYYHENREQGPIVVFSAHTTAPASGVYVEEEFISPRYMREKCKDAPSRTLALEQAHQRLN